MSHKHRFFIRWTPGPGQGGYVTKRSPNRRPYVQHPADPEIKAWASRAAAERFLARKDTQWAARCAVVPAPVQSPAAPPVPAQAAPASAVPSLAERHKTPHLYVLPAEPLQPVQVPPQSREVYIAMLAAHERKLKREQQRVVQRQDRAQSREAYIRGMLTMHEHKLKREQQRVREYQLKIQHYEAKAAEPVQAIPSPAQIRHEVHIREKLAEHRCRFEHEQELVRLYRTKVRYYERKAAASQNRLRK